MSSLCIVAGQTAIEEVALILTLIFFHFHVNLRDGKLCANEDRGNSKFQIMENIRK